MSGREKALLHACNALCASAAFRIRVGTADGEIAARLPEGPLDIVHYEGGEDSTVRIGESGTGG